MGPFQPKLQKYPSTKYGTQNRRFQFSWFSKFPWLEYSISKDKAFCFLCYIFHDKPSRNEAFVVDGVQNWNNLKDPSKHIDKRLNAQSSQQILENRLRLKTLIICNVLVQYNLLVENLRGQGYDGASNMAGEWNGLQSLFLNDCLYAYYVHYFAHRLQLVLVAVSKEVNEVWLFFSKLSSIINFASASFKRYSELKSAREKEIIDLIALEELETGTGANQVRTLQRAGDTRWSSHFTSVILGKMINDGSSRDMRGEAKGAYREIKSFKFVFILLLLNKALGIYDILCRFRDSGWDDFIRSVVSFCEKYDIAMLNMSDCYMEGTGRSCQQKDYVTVEHHYHFDVFNAIIDFQLMELNSRFSEQTVELLTLSSALDPVDGFKSFDIDNICSLAEKFYPHDFTPNEVLALRRELEHYQIDALSDPRFQNMASLSELCRRFVETIKSQHYLLIDRLIRLVLTLPVSTATTERAFSAMKLIKTSLRSEIENEFFFSDCMVIYVEREITDIVDSDSVIDDFYNLKPRKVQLR
ncbi:TTF-type domain-containing protein [Citrus sinensis]|nr:TTF-type domain-containing protein [Citrus sinensis]